MEQAPTISSIYQGLRTRGSGGLASTFAPMRKVGAQAREMLLMAAARQWQAKRRDCRAQNGAIVHSPTKRRLSYGELVDLLVDKSPQTARVRAVLKLPAQSAGWGKPVPKGRGRGLACLFGDTCSAQVAEVSVDDDGTVHVLQVVSAVDCGIAVNPDGVRAMTEGAINFGLTAVLTGEITIKHGAVEQSNFHDYQVLRINQAPEIEVHIVPSTEDPNDVGELGVMLVPLAVANAVFDATGVRVRRLPIDPQLLKRSQS